MNLRKWYETLNRRVFFWPTEGRLSDMLNAEPYRGREHVVLTVETVTLLERHAGPVVLSPINSGSTRYDPRPRPRGHGTFLAPEAYPSKRDGGGIYAEVRWPRRPSIAPLPSIRLALSAELRRGG